MNNDDDYDDDDDDRFSLEALGDEQATLSKNTETQIATSHDDNNR